ncbi:MAG: LysR family transcriptional regulator [Legionellaceae bacterium]|nr:LysR family transcriptional regulator [Legionellaceae bacterium]
MSHNFHEDTEIFAAVVDNKGFNHAAKSLGISQALVSRRVKSLEKQLKSTLLVRSTRTFELTAEGVLLYNYAKKIEVDKQTILLAIENMSLKPAGLLKVGAPVNFGRQYVAPALCEFMKIYPDIKIDLELSNKQINIINDKFDLVIRGSGFQNHKPLKDNNLIAKKLLSSPIILCASSEYLNHHKPITSINDIQGSIGIDFNVTKSSFSSSEILWEIKNNESNIELKLNKKFTCNDIDTSIKMACDGNGIAKFAKINVERELKTKQLIQILPNLNLGKYDIFAVFAHRSLPQRTRKLLEYFERQWSQDN